jgi:hypothetical protein
MLNSDRSESILFGERIVKKEVSSPGEERWSFTGECSFVPILRANLHSAFFHADLDTILYHAV